MEKSLLDKYYEKKERENIKRCAKSIYLVGDNGFRDMMIYLAGAIEWGRITEEDADKITDEIGKECANIYCYKIEELKKQINEMK